MVFHFFERFVGNFGKPEEFLSDHRYLQLIEEGFSEDEAKHLTWFYSRQTHGKVLGGLSGLGVIYFFEPYYRSLVKSFPRLYYQPWIGNLLKLGVVVFGVQLGDYITTCRRHGANFWIANLYNNNAYIASKDAFVRNFETINRKFTDDEVEKFLLNKGNKEEFKRKWIYNPYIHGEESAFKEKVENVLKSKKAPYNKKDVKEKILKENEEKIRYGESIRLETFRITDYVDKTGVKAGIDANPLLVHYKPIH